MPQQPKRCLMAKRRAGGVLAKPRNAILKVYLFTGGDDELQNGAPVFA